MKYVDQITKRLVSHTQRAVSYIEMGEYSKAMEALRDTIADLRELLKAVSLIEKAS